MVSVYINPDLQYPSCCSHAKLYFCLWFSFVGSLPPFLLTYQLALFIPKL